MLHPYDRAYFRPKYHISDITMAEKVKDYYRKVVFHAEGYGGSVHHSQSLLEDLEVRKLSQDSAWISMALSAAAVSVEK